MPLPHEPGPHWGEVGIHGLHRQREWDAVATVSAPGLAGDEVAFVVLADGRTLVEAADPALDPRPLVSAVSLEPPFRARAVRRDGALWAVAVRLIEVVELAADPGGDEIEVAWDGRERTVRVSGELTPVGFPELERIGAARHATWVVRARRIEGRWWEIAVSAL